MSYRNQSIRNLKDFKEMADQFKVSFCLMDGTLLGAYRDGDFCEGDYKDVDIGVLAQNYESVSAVVYWLKREGFEESTFMLNDKIESYSLFRGGCRIDIARIRRRGKDCYNLFRGERIGKDFNTGRGAREICAYTYPSKCFDKFQQIEFKGMTFNIPDRVENYLSVRYADWKVPVKHKDHDFLDVKQCPCLVKNYEY